MDIIKIEILNDSEVLVNGVPTETIYYEASFKVFNTWVNVSDYDTINKTAEEIYKQVQNTLESIYPEKTFIIE